MGGQRRLAFGRLRASSARKVGRARITAQAWSPASQTNPSRVHPRPDPARRTWGRTCLRARGGISRTKPKCACSKRTRARRYPNELSSWRHSPNQPEGAPRFRTNPSAAASERTPAWRPKRQSAFILSRRSRRCARAGRRCCRRELDRNRHTPPMRAERNRQANDP
jgi:hypothetical protein